MPWREVKGFSQPSVAWSQRLRSSGVCDDSDDSRHGMD
jgi:hypothetical protein